MAGHSWTEEQQAAIDLRGGSILVSAAAGSGKTAVLTERIVSRVTGENAVDIDRLLVVTFSNAAAAEMKERIGKRLAELAAQNPYDTGLRRQLTLLRRARICTIHSFCGELLRAEISSLPLDYGFRIGEEQEMRLLLRESADEILEEAYAAGDADFLSLMELVSGGRDDSRLLSTLLELYDFLRAHPFYEEWLAEKLSFYDDTLPLEETVWGKVIMEHLEGAFRFALGHLASACLLCRKDDIFRKAYLPTLSDELYWTKNAFIALRQDGFDACRQAVLNIPSSSFKPTRDADEALKLRIAALRKAARDQITECKTRFFTHTSQSFSEDLRALRPVVERLFGLVEELDRVFSEKKREINAVDFSDLEQFALRLLVEKVPDGEHRPTPLARRLSEELEEIYIDEYQDTNLAQDMLFSAISREEKNFFLVGDIKQSIYRFRQASPELFAGRRDAYPLYDPQAPRLPSTILLARNFRSRKRVTDLINFIFSRCMSRRVGEVEYNEEEALIPGASYQTNPDDTPELLIADRVGDSSLPKEELEIRMVGQRILQLLCGEEEITENGHFRPIRPGDIAILLRSPGKHVSDYLRILSGMGIPVTSDSAGEFLTAREIQVLLSLLRVISNPAQDVPLLSVLMSPIFGLTAEDVARIRLSDRKKGLYDALLLSAREGFPPAVRVQEELKELRRISLRSTVSELITRIYLKTGICDIFLAAPHGEERLARLRLFADFARRFEETGNRSLHSFVGYMERVCAGGKDFVVPATSGGGDSVTVMSIHKSKGLEFPVCFLCDTSREFNRRELSNPSLVHSRLGFASIRREEGLFRRPTLPLEALRLTVRDSSLSEELRILYVALTRAREKLIITMTSKDIAKECAEIDTLCRRTPGKLSSFAVKKANSPADILLMSLLHLPDAFPLRHIADVYDHPSFKDDVALDVRIIPAMEILEETSLSLPATENAKTPDYIFSPPSGLSRTLRERFSFTYPYARETAIPAKISVSELAKAPSERYNFDARPRFMEQEGLTGAEKGTALHQFMQFCNPRAAAQDPEEELARLVREEYLTPEAAAGISMKEVKTYFDSELSRRILASPRLYREERFLFEASGSYGGVDYTGSMIQGVIDLAFEEDGGIWLVDYKTDRVRRIEELEALYADQLRLYMEAGKTCFSLPVRGGYLYSFALGQFIPILPL